MVFEDSKSPDVTSTEKSLENAKVAAATAYSSQSSHDEPERPKTLLGEAAFDTTEYVRHYKPIETYEGIHRWDPEFEWEEEEEKKIVRTVIPNYPQVSSKPPPNTLTDCGPDRPAHMCVRLSYFLRTAARQRKHCPGLVR